MSKGWFRGIGELTIPRLGRVTLLAGRNGVGKTTVLDAIRLYAAMGHRFALPQLIERREGLPPTVHDRGGARAPLDFGTLFHRRDRGTANTIRIGPIDPAPGLEIEAKPRTRGFSTATAATLGSSGTAQVLEISFLGETDTLFTAEFNKGYCYISNPSPMRHLNFDDRQDFFSAAKCESVGPESLTTEDAARLWDNIALTEQEDLAVSALNLVFGDEVKRVAMLGGGRGSEDGRRIAVRLKRRERPVSLQSLGDGAVRLFGIALALANAGAGYLVIDEAENGIHHSVQPAMWKMVLRTAHRDGVQVLATTHSWRNSWPPSPDRLGRAGIEVSDRDPGGTVVRGKLPDPDVGVWIMPDNRSPGELEDFIAAMIPRDDSVWPLSPSLCRWDSGRESAVQFQEGAAGQGSFHAWLATRERPRPMGLAIGARDLEVGGAVCVELTEWLRRSFG